MDPMALVTPAIGLMFWTCVVFVLLLVLLKKFAWKPILDAVDERNESIDNALKSAENAKAEMQALNADNERILAEARLERDTLLKEAREIKGNIINEAKEQANVEADKILTSAKEQISNEKMKAITELKNTVAPPILRMVLQLNFSLYSFFKYIKNIIENHYKELVIKYFL